MHVKKLCLIFLSVIASAAALKCWRCERARSENDCRRKGSIQTCTSTADVCSIQVRRKNNQTFLFKRCKQSKACNNNRRQNAQKDGLATQCNRLGNLSVCTCCCNTTKCNRAICSPSMPSRTTIQTRQHTTTSTTSTTQSTTAANLPNALGPVLSDDPKICPKMKNMPHGEVNCTNNNQPGSTCSFECREKDYKVHPIENNVIRCMESGSWNKEAPCCSLPCPPFALFDVISMIHASNNKTYRILSLVSRFLRRSLKGEEHSGTRHAYIEFSGKTDFSMTFRDIMKGKKLPIPATKRFNTPDGKTNIGKALSQAYHSLRAPNSGNRPKVRDVIFLGTDSSSDDDVTEAAKKWRDSDALIFVLYMPKQRLRYPDYQQMKEITGSVGNIFQFDTNAHKTGRFILEDLLSQVCYQRCHKALHDT